MPDEFLPLPNEETGTARVRHRKAELYHLIADLHGQQIRDTFIAQYLGVSRSHVRRILDEQGLKEHWSDSKAVFETLPRRLMEACQQFNDVRKRPK